MLSARAAIMTLPFSSSLRITGTTFLHRSTTRATFQSVRSISRAISKRQVSTSSTVNKPVWTGGRVILLAASAAAIAYTVGSIEGRTTNTPTLNPHRANHEYASVRDMENAVEELRNLFGRDTISTDDDDLHRHGFSEWSSYNPDQLPVAVAYPKSTEDVSRLAKVCSKYRIPMIPYSGGTSLEANFSAPFGGMSIDFAFMDQIVAVHEDDMDVVVQPSVPWMSLNDKLKPHGLFFPVDPGPTAQIGGMVGTGCSGTNAVRYGTMRDWVINLTVVLVDGTIIKTRGRPRKSAAGYSLTNLFVGSEGTLGIVTEITLKLAIVPQDTSVAVVPFPSIRDAAAAASQIMRAGIPIAAMELMDEVSMKIVNETATSARRWKESPTMFFKFSGTKAGVRENIGLVKAIARQHHAGDFEFATSEADKEELWSARKEILWRLLALRKDRGGEVWSTDVAVPFSKLPELIERTKADLDSLGLFASALGHVGDGNFHTSIMYDKRDPEQQRKVEKCVHDMVDRALELEGTCTGEHGVGMGKKDYLVKELGVETVNVMKTVKRALDPNLLMNPGKIMDF